MSDINEEKLRHTLLCSPYKVLVDLGVWAGHSSRILLDVARSRGGIVYGIDNELSGVNKSLGLDPHYQLIIGDSVTVGKRWQGPRPDFIFVDTIHTKEHVLCELYYWYDLIAVGGT